MLQYFRLSLSYHLPLRALFCLFLSGRFTHDSLYHIHTPKTNQPTAPSGRDTEHYQPQISRKTIKVQVKLPAPLPQRDHCKPRATDTIILPAKSDSDVMFCLQGYQGLRIDRSPVY